MQQISKDTFMNYLENESDFEYLGEIEGKIYARQKKWASKIPSSQRPKFRLVFAVL